MKGKKLTQTRRHLIKNTVIAAAGIGVGAGLPSTQAKAQPHSSASAPSSLPLAGKVAFITGAARGIGRATAVELARQGADIALLDIANPQGVNAVAPTAVNTPLYRSEGQRRSTSMNTAQEQDKAKLEFHSLPVPAVEPTDIAAAIAFLAKDEARYISGAVLDVAAGGNARYTA